MQVKKLDIEGLLAIYPDQSSDENGRYSYYFDSKKMKQAGVLPDFVQEHASCYEQQWTVRGLHYQAQPKSQYKLVRVVKGSIWDVCVDIRADSPTFGMHESIELAGDTWTQLLVPPGLAHGFCTLEKDTEVSFSLTDYNDKEFLRGLLWSDPELKIDWPCREKPNYIYKIDQTWPNLKNLNSPFR
jgi:dTDP-4-dehydrorhamnose 3,5-epimerase